MFKQIFFTLSILLALLGLPAPTQPVPLSTSEAEANYPMITGMDAEVGKNGWYLSKVSIYLSNGEIISVSEDGEHNVQVPDGFGGQATQIVRIDTIQPDVNVRIDNEHIYIEVTDTGSRPESIAISQDGGETWQTQANISSPYILWEVARQAGADNTRLIVLASDHAGNVTTHEATFKAGE